MRIIGCMSGTSLDGLDLALCDFNDNNNTLEYSILHAKTYKYSSLWESKLRNAPRFSGFDLIELDKDFGLLIANYIQQFITDYNLQNIDYIASHGHTVFHQPEKNITLQIGNGIAISSQLNIPVVNDFRSLDVSLNGQGAPLVPIGDKMLFSNYNYCLNLGGFSNVSFEKNKKRIAFDIAPVNLVLNLYAKKKGFDYDAEGKLGRKGTVIPKLLKRLNEIEYYKKAPPKSLGKEWLDEEFLTLIDSNSNDNDVLRTVYEHIAMQIGTILDKRDTKTLITGGGTFNIFLIELIKKYSKSKIIIPTKKLIDYKEALIFALLAFLRVNKKINVLKSVTGADRDSCSGTIN